MAFRLLGQILDIEWMLLRDQGRSAAELARQDRELLEKLTPGAAGRGDPEQALRLWLDGRRRELDERTLGVKVSEALTLLQVSLVALALAAGAGTARALLGSAAVREPTNVLHFLFATLAWPLLLLIGSLLLLSLRGRLGRSVLLEDFYLRGLGVLGRLTRSRAHEDWDVAHEWRRLRRSARRYRDLEAGTLLSAAQWVALSFHLGALLTLVSSAVFSDLAFAWSTTNDSLGWSTLSAVFRVITAPWCATLGTGCVSAELVRATQFSRLSGQYALPEGALLSGAWWPVLGFCLMVYGILPRLGFALALGALVRRRASHLSERVLELRARLRAGVEVISRPAPSGADDALALPELGQPERAPGLASRACWVIHWRGAVLDEAGVVAACAALGLHGVRQDSAGGSDFAEDAALLGRAGRESSGEAPAAVVLLVEGWEAPDKATRGFVQALRKDGAPERPVFVGVLVADADAPELALWRDRLRLLQDPLIGVVPIVVPIERPAASSGGVR